MGIIFSTRPPFREALKEKCHELDLWSFVIRGTRYKHQWQALIGEIVKEGIYNIRRLEVVDILTEEVIQNLNDTNSPIQAQQIATAYQDWKHQTLSKHVIESVDGTVERLANELRETKDELYVANQQICAFQKTHMHHRQYMRAATAEKMQK